MALTELSYVGSRPYIRGADLYTWFERQIGSSLSEDVRPVTVSQFRLVREVERDGAWSIEPASDASATLDVLDRTGRSHRYSFRESGEVIVRRTPDIPSNVSKLERSGDFAGRAILAAPRNATDLLNGLIEANKRLHAETLASRGLPADKIRLIFIENLPLAELNGNDTEAGFRHLGERKAADRTYTLNAVTLNGATLRICYSY